MTSRQTTDKEAAGRGLPAPRAHAQGTPGSTKKGASKKHWGRRRAVLHCAVRANKSTDRQEEQTKKKCAWAHSQ